MSYHLYFQKSSFFNKKPYHQVSTEDTLGRDEVVQFPLSLTQRMCFIISKLLGLLLFSDSVASSTTFHHKYNQVPAQLCWEEQSCCPGCLLLPTLTRTLILSQRFFSTFQWPVGVSTSGHFYLCWMLPLPSWNWPADAAAQPTCRRSSWKVKVKTKVEIEKNYVTVCWHLSQPALSWSWKMWHHCFREATRVELVLGTRLLWMPDCLLIANSNLCCETNFQCYVTYNISMNWNRSPCKRKDRKAWIWEHRHRLNICQSPWNSK